VQQRSGATTAPRARLPSVTTLSQEHGISHITTEKALTVLKDDGLVVAVIGKGYYVAER
jgi:DNA-binding GntR family transcriptional regulator